MNKSILILVIVGVALYIYMKSRSGATGGTATPQGNVATGGTSTGEPWAEAAGTVGAAGLTALIGGLFGSGSGSPDADPNINSD